VSTERQAHGGEFCAVGLLSDANHAQRLIVPFTLCLTTAAALPRGVQAPLARRPPNCSAACGAPRAAPPRPSRQWQGGVVTARLPSVRCGAAPTVPAAQALPAAAQARNLRTEAPAGEPACQLQHLLRMLCVCPFGPFMRFKGLPASLCCPTNDCRRPCLVVCAAAGC
jgi:hypothetical protein